MTEPVITEAMGLVAELALASGVENIAHTLPGCWEHQVDSSWWIALNGKREPVACSRGPKVPPFSCYIEFNGWPAGILNAFGGTIAAGAIANEDTFISALQEAIGKAERGRPSHDP